MTKQEMFDAAFTGLRGQGFVRAGRTLNGYFFPQYEDAEGRRCAIGHLGGGWHGDKIGFVTELREAHDFSSEPARMESKLRNIAHIHGLTVPE